MYFSYKLFFFFPGLARRFDPLIFPNAVEFKSIIQTFLLFAEKLIRLCLAAAQSMCHCRYQSMLYCSANIAVLTALLPKLP